MSDLIKNKVYKVREHLEKYRYFEGKYIVLLERPKKRGFMQGMTVNKDWNPSEAGIMEKIPAYVFNRTIVVSFNI